MSTYFCFLCKMRLSEKQKISLDAGKTRHTKTSLASFIHTISGLTFNTEDIFVCTTCFDTIDELDYVQMRSLQLKEQLMRSLKKNETQKQDPEFICGVCNRKFSSDDGLLLHISKEHAATEECNVGKVNEAEENVNTSRESKYHQCDMKLNTRTDLKVHIQKLHNGEQFVCELCGQTYKQRAQFDIHIGIHKGVNPFTCVFCKKSFTQKVALRRHMPLHTGQNPYQCDLCGKQFAHHSSFNIHTASHMGKKGHKCSECGLALISSSHLKRHMKVHTGEKKYECNMCKKKFGERYNLVSHQKVHKK